MRELVIFMVFTVIWLLTMVVLGKTRLAINLSEIYYKSPRTATFILVWMILFFFVVLHGETNRFVLSVYFLFFLGGFVSQPLLDRTEKEIPFLKRRLQPDEKIEGYGI